MREGCDGCVGFLYFLISNTLSPALSSELLGNFSPFHNVPHEAVNHSVCPWSQ